jgi:phosphomannomutase
MYLHSQNQLAMGPRHAKILYKMASDWSYKTHPDILVLFDIDGTLTPARKTISNEMLETLKVLRKRVVVGFVGGSDLVKQKEQIGENRNDD